jgi:hypothetical protein
VVQDMHLDRTEHHAVYGGPQPLSVSDALYRFPSHTTRLC